MKSSIACKRHTFTNPPHVWGARTYITHGRQDAVAGHAQGGDVDSTIELRKPQLVAMDSATTALLVALVLTSVIIVLLVSIPITMAVRKRRQGTPAESHRLSPPRLLLGVMIPNPATWCNCYSYIVHNLVLQRQVRLRGPTRTSLTECLTKQQSGVLFSVLCVQC